jgi:hypothetical protein
MTSSASIPSILFGILIACFYATLMHAWRGRGLTALLVFLVVSQVGFWIGQSIGAWLSWSLGDVGALHLVPATLGSLALLGLAVWLSPRPMTG